MVTAKGFMGVMLVFDDIDAARLHAEDSDILIVRRKP